MLLISTVFLVTVLFYATSGWYVFKSLDAIPSNRNIILVLTIPLLVPLYIVFKVFFRAWYDHETLFSITIDGLHIQQRGKTIRYIPRESITCYGIAVFHSRQDPVLFFCTDTQDAIYKRLESNRSWARTLFHFSGYAPDDLEKNKEGIWTLAVGVTVYPDQPLKHGTVIKCACRKGILKRIEDLWGFAPVKTGACLLKYNLFDSF